MVVDWSSHCMGLLQRASLLGRCSFPKWREKRAAVPCFIYFAAAFALLARELWSDGGAAHGRGHQSLRIYLIRPSGVHSVIMAGIA